VQLANTWRRSIKPFNNTLGTYSTQATDKGRTGAVTEHAQRFYFGLVDATMEEASRLSAPDEDVTGPNRTLWRELSANFVLNLDECNSQASQGSSFIVGDSKIRKHEKNETSSRVSITTVECGNAAGNDGPSMYLMAGEQMPGHFEELYGSSSFLRTSGAPRNSFVVMTPSAFMTNKAWDGAAEKLAKGIRAMPVIVDYPEFWLVLHLDGYKSHVMTYPAQAIFRRYRILVVKENSDSSQINQAYDQEPAKKGKGENRRW
jgi:hypothetical protein